MSTAEANVDERRTERLLLRRPLRSDIAWMASMHSDPANYTHAPDGAHAPDAAEAIAESSILQWSRGGIGYWLVEHEGEPVGMAGLSPMEFAGRPCFNLYYRFVPAGRGRGFASEVCREALSVGALVDPARPVVVRTRPANEPARRLALAVGLQRRADLDTLDGFVVYVSANWD